MMILVNESLCIKRYILLVQKYKDEVEINFHFICVLKVFVTKRKKQNNVNIVTYYTIKPKNLILDFQCSIKS